MKDVQTLVPLSSARIRNQTGFTMVEVLVVVAIVGIIGSLAAPSFMRLMNNERVDASVERIADAVILSRSSAIKLGANVVLCASSNGTSCSNDWANGWLAYEDQDKNSALDSGEPILLRHSSSDKQIGIAVKAQSGNTKTSVRFNYRGFVDAASTITISRGERKQDLSINTFGKPRLI